jgi:pyruvate dehydrogenase E1 component alpha subunit
LKHFRRRVGEAGLLDGAELDGVESEVAALIDHAVELARAAPPPDSDALLRDVYVSY